VLDEKHVLKRVAAEVVPPEILARKKQPYRAPDALSFAGPEAAEWIDAITSQSALSEAGVFSPGGARQVIAKCRARAGSGQFSNTDNMAVVGLLSTQLVFEQFIRTRPEAGPPVPLRTLVEHVPGEAPALTPG
jgi:asparagine synthase (glutamine-hydrolysing)